MMALVDSMTSVMMDINLLVLVFEFFLFFVLGTLFFALPSMSVEQSLCSDDERKLDGSTLISEQRTKNKVPRTILLLA